MFKIAHFSDPHLGPLPPARLTDLGGKRISGFLSWHLNRRKIHTGEALARIIEDIKAHKPDHVALTGDLINIGLPAEYSNARAWLEKLGPPEWVTIVPGNHDAYIAGASEEGMAQWQDYYAGDMRLPGIASEGNSPNFPFVRLRRNAAIIGVSTAVPTAIGNASGRLGDEQIAALKLVLAETRGRGFYRILMIHHPPIAGLCSGRKSLVDAAQLVHALEAEGAELVLFGHNHRHHHIELMSRFGEVHIFGVPSASLSSRTEGMAAWNLYDIRRQGRSWLTSVTQRGLDPASRSMVTLDQFQLVQRSASEVDDG